MSDLELSLTLQYYKVYKIVELIKIKDKEFKKYISAKELDERVVELSQEINNDYVSKEILFIIILNGAFMFAADLLKRISGNHKICFIKVSSYQGIESSGSINTLIGLNEEIWNKDVIIIEDIVDTGITLSNIIRDLNLKKPRSLEICSLFFKPQSFKADFDVRYKGFDISNEFIVGYGLDYDGYGRNLSEIYQLK